MERPRKVRLNLQSLSNIVTIRANIGLRKMERPRKVRMIFKAYQTLSQPGLT
jgi:hypothetical protein